MYGRDIFFLCGEEKKNEEKIYLLPLPFFLSLSLAHNFFSVPFSFPFLLAERMFPRKQIMYEKEIIIIRRERESGKNRKETRPRIGDFGAGAVASPGKRWC